MVNNNPYHQYQRNAVACASKGDLTLMLYNGAVKHIKHAVNMVAAKNIERAHHSIVRAQEIISYLSESLNPDFEISNSLAALYDYINHRLVQANIKKDGDILSEVLGLVVELRDTWVEALQLSKSPVASGQ